MTEVIVRIHSVHLANVEQRQAAADPQTKSPDLGRESACFRQLASTSTIAIYHYYSTQGVQRLHVSQTDFIYLFIFICTTQCTIHISNELHKLDNKVAN